MKFKIGATIPTTQYGNIMPEIEVEADTFEDAQAIAMPQIESIWAKYCEPGKELKSRQTVSKELIELTSELTNNSVMYDKENHIYYDKKGKELLSGSMFAKRFEHPFDREHILKVMEKAYNIPSNDIKSMWDLKAEASRSFGTGLHAALELYGKYYKEGQITGEKYRINKALHDNPIIRKAVEEFYTNRENEIAIYEPFVADLMRNLCGRIDRLLILDIKDKICDIEDYKTSVDIENIGKPKSLVAPFNNLENSKINIYWLQLSFYASIIQKAGWKVNKLRIHSYTNSWQSYEHDVIDINKGL